MATAGDLHQTAAEFLQETFPVPPAFEGAFFSSFRREQVEEAAQLARRFSEIAAAGGGVDGVGDVLAFAREEVQTRLPSVVKYALLIFLTHDRIGLLVGAPTIEERHPTAVRSMSETREARTEEDPRSLSFFREDVYANDHHAHWHLVYKSDWERQERQGELFLYMHQQMLARYDAERLGVGRPPVEALSVSEQAVIDEGYDPHMPRFGARGDNAPFDDEDLRARLKALYTALATQLFETAYERKQYAPSFDPNGPEPVLNLLGATLEAEGEPLPSFPGRNLHNTGHVRIAALGVGPQGQPLTGVMRDTSNAIRDPVFWRWHKLIDEVGAAWQDRQPPHDFTAGDNRGPDLLIRKGPDGESPDLILTLRSALDLTDFTDLAAGQSMGTETFAGARWDDGYADTAPATRELLTHMTRRESAGATLTYLDMVDEFALFIRVENHSEEPVAVTGRVFIVPEQWRDDRRRWMEMDKFLHTVPPGRSVLYRPSTMSSVIRKPATRPPGPPPREEGHEPSAYCSCGWPYNLLLPRGTREGMPFRLLVMFTDAAWDTAHEERCGSMSFCGVRDRGYPDRRAMGYPFDRPFGDAGLVQTLNGLANVGMRTFTIRWV